jgi:hypothetical protein
MKTKEKIKARRIRVEEQLSIKDIATRLGVAKSTVSGWVRNLPLSSKTIEARCLAGCIKGGKTRCSDARAIRIQYQQDGMDMAKKYKDDPLFMAGCMMHWAEGTKDKNSVVISNTDSHFMQLWLKFIQRFFNVKPTDLVVYVHCYLGNGKTKRQIESYWLRELDIPRLCLRKTTVVTNHKSSTGAKKNRHPYGVGIVKVHSTKIVQQIWGAIKSIAGITDKNKWLD